MKDIKEKIEETDKKVNGFKKLGLSYKSIEALEKKGFTEPTTIQEKVIPLLLAGKKDIVGQSQTGTGKTAGFALPILEKIKGYSKTIQAIVLVPTRELALQVAQEIESLKGDKVVRILSVYGGAPIGPQRRQLSRGVDIVVGTPGRIMDLQRKGSLVLDDILYAVLDEADEMLNMGFVEDIETILKNTPEDKIMLLFSATMPKAILKIAEKYMREYEFIEIEKAQVITKMVEQVYYEINGKDRIEGLRRIIDYYQDFHGIIFCNTKISVDGLASDLIKLGYSSAALHGDITQSQREKILLQFKKRDIRVLIATDVAARGIDVNDLTHVVNYSLPQSAESYVHRIGRTGRAGKKGIAITLVIPSERRKLELVERVNKCKLKKQELPTAREIVGNKEEQAKEMLKNIVETNLKRSSKYYDMAEKLLSENRPEEVVASLLRHILKDELELNTYKEISKYKPSRYSADSDDGGFGRSRGRERGRGRGKSRQRPGRSRSGGGFGGGRSGSRGPKKSSSSYSRERS